MSPQILIFIFLSSILFSNFTFDILKVFSNIYRVFRYLSTIDFYFGYSGIKLSFYDLNLFKYNEACFIAQKVIYVGKHLANT